MFQLKVAFADPKFHIPEVQISQLETYLRKIEQEGIQTLPKKDTLISLVFVNDQAIQELNKEYRKKDIPTDVLSFSLFDKDSPEELLLLGEIYISLPTAKRQAQEKNHSLQTEFNILFVHGVLHLLGFDHQLDKDFYQMNALEKKILK